MLFCVWEYARIWAHLNYSLDLYLNYLRPISLEHGMFPVFFILYSPQGSPRRRGGDSCGNLGLWWLDGNDGEHHSLLPEKAGNIPFPLYLVTNLIHLEPCLWKENSSISMLTNLAFLLLQFCLKQTSEKINVIKRQGI